MAAAEYYFGSAGGVNQNQPNMFPSQQSRYNLQQPPQSNQQLQHYDTLPPYSLHAPPPQPQPQSYPNQPPRQTFPLPPNGHRPPTAPYPQTQPMRPQPYAPKSQPTKNGYLGAPLQPYRSHSQPPRVHFVEGKQSRDFSDSSSDSESSHRRRRHRERKHRASYHSDSRSCSSSPERDHSHKRESRQHKKAHKDRDTFLGAGAGGLVGDLIFPGLGTAAGLLIGGYGGRKHAEKRSKSHAGVVREGGRRSADG